MTHSRTVFLVVSLLHPAHAPRWSYATGSPCCSVSKSCLTLRPQGLQPARLLCPPLPLRVCSSSCALSRGCWLTISFSAAPLSCFQSFPASGSFPIVGSSHQSAKVLELQHQSFPVSIQGWFPFRLIGPINHHKLAGLPDTALRSGVAVWGLFLLGRLATYSGRQDASTWTWYHHLSVSKMLLTIAAGDCSSSPLCPCSEPLYSSLLNNGTTRSNTLKKIKVMALLSNFYFFN